MQTRKELYSTLGYTPGKEWFYPDSTINRKWRNLFFCISIYMYASAKLNIFWKPFFNPNTRIHTHSFLPFTSSFTFHSSNALFSWYPQRFLGYLCDFISGNSHRYSYLDSCTLSSDHYHRSAQTMTYSYVASSHLATLKCS